MRVRTFALAGLVAAGLTAAAMYPLRKAGRCALVRFSGFRELRPRVFFDPVLADPDRKRDSFEKYGTDRGGTAAAQLTPFGDYTVFGPRGWNADVIAHELAHAELKARLGYWRYSRAIPKWFDEGAGMHVDERPRFSEAAYLTAKHEFDSWYRRAAHGASRPLPSLAEPPPGSFYHGVFPGGKNGMGSDIEPADVTEYQDAVGKRPTWIYFCDNWYEGTAFPGRTASWIRANGSIPYVRLMLLSGPNIPRPDPVYNLENILRGKFDSEIREWMRGARAFGTPLLAEYGVEVNGFWFPWNGLWNREDGSYEDSIERFRKVYRHIVSIAREEGASNVRWVFHVDPWDEPVVPWNKFEHYYPGDEWVDWVGVSVYGRQAPSDKFYPTFREQMDWVYRRLTKLTKKPVIVCEYGTISDSGQAGWARAALTDLLSHRWPRVIGFSWWNSGFYNDAKNPRGFSNMRVQDNPRLAAVLRRYVGRNPAVLSAPALRP